MNWFELRQKFRGREAWRTINKTLFVGIYSLLIFGVMLIPRYLGWIGLTLAIFLPSYIAFFSNHLREMEKRDKGNKVIEGWVTHRPKVGERIHFCPTKFETVDKLSRDDRISVEKFVKSLDKLSKVAKLETGLKRFKPKQITYNKILENETMSEEERKKIEKEEKKELENNLKDYEKMELQEKHNNKNNNKEELDDDISEKEK